MSKSIVVGNYTISGVLGSGSFATVRYIPMYLCDGVGFTVDSRLHILAFRVLILRVLPFWLLLRACAGVPRCEPHHGRKCRNQSSFHPEAGQESVGEPRKRDIHLARH